MILIDGYDKRKHPARAEYRLLSREEALALKHGDVIHFRAHNGKARRIRCNGQVRTWKRSPTRIEIPMKYGYRECATFVWRDGAMRLWGHNLELLMFVRDVSDPIPATEIF